MADFTSLDVTPSPGSYSPDTATTSTQIVNWDELFFGPLRRFFVDLAGFLPDLLIALCILAVGWLIGKILQILMTLFLKSIGFDRFAKKVGITDLLSEGDAAISPHQWFGGLTFWIVFFVSFILSLDKLRLGLASSHLNQLFHFILTVVVVLVTFIFGMVLSLLASRIIRSTAQNAKIQQPDLYIHLTRWIILAFTVLVCVTQVGLPREILFMAVSAVFITLCITFVIAFGIGGIGWAGKVLDRTLKEGDSQTRK